MSDPPDPEEEGVWRRRLGSTANNRGWALAEKRSRTPEEDQEMLDAAHAAMHLWSKIGKDRNFALGRLLLGQVHALLGNTRYAMQYATSAHQFFTGTQSAAWELALAHAVLANAAHGSGNVALHASSYRTAQEAIAKLPDPEDREIVLATMHVIPKPASAQSAG